MFCVKENCQKRVLRNAQRIYAATPLRNGRLNCCKYISARPESALTLLRSSLCKNSFAPAKRQPLMISRTGDACAPELNLSQNLLTVVSLLCDNSSHLTCCCIARIVPHQWIERGLEVIQDGLLRGEVYTAVYGLFVQTCTTSHLLVAQN